MSYTRLKGGELTRLEKQSLTGALHSDDRGVINTPMVMATAVDAVASPLSSIAELLHSIDIAIPSNLLGDGRFALGPVSKTAYNKSIFNQQWNPAVVNTGNVSKKAFAKLGLGMGGVIALIVISRMVAPSAINAATFALGTGYRATSAKIKHNQIMDGIESVGKLQAPPNLGNSAAMQVAMFRLLKGLSDNNSNEIRKGAAVLQGLY